MNKRCVRAYLCPSPPPPATVAVSFLLARVMSQQEWLACPKPTLHLGHADCGGLGLPALFEPQEWRVPGPVRLAVRAASGVEWESARMRPMQVHALAIGLFASLIGAVGSRLLVFFCFFIIILLLLCCCCMYSKHTADNLDASAFVLSMCIVCLSV
jgi:hypothetical protein